jgi:hypothetical protein
MIRRIEKITSSAVTGLPLWNVTPCFRRMSHSFVVFPDSIDSASSISSLLKSGVRTARHS